MERERGEGGLSFVLRAKTEKGEPMLDQPKKEIQMLSGEVEVGGRGERDKGAGSKQKTKRRQGAEMLGRDGLRDKRNVRQSREQSKMSRVVCRVKQQPSVPKERSSRNPMEDARAEGDQRSRMSGRVSQSPSVVRLGS